MRRLTLTLTALAALVLAGGCTDSTSSQDRELHAQQSTYDRLVAGQPAQAMDYSPTRETINFWIDTWDEPGKTAYVYLQSATGELLGYYVLEGLPVSYCASLTPTYTFQDAPGDGSSYNVKVPAPAMDGVYYSGGQCNSYYGKDATTGAYIEYTAGLGINVLLYDAPLPNQNVPPLGPSSISDVKRR
jgi:hypothetical protein